MYLGHYKLKEMPFRLAPDPRYMYWSAGHSAARECIRSAQESDQGGAIIVGDRGTGKSELLECLQGPASKLKTARLEFPPRTLAELEEWLRDSAEDAAAGDGGVVICDNAHLFHESMLAVLLRPDPPALNLRRVLAGEPPLERLLAAPRLESLARRCERARLPPLTHAEVSGYITHRLNVAGANGTRIFRDDACDAVHRETKGNPRLINALCDASMIAGCERDLPEIGAPEVRLAREDISRLFIPHTEEAAPQAPLAPLDDQAPGRGQVLARLRLMHGERAVVERELACGSLTIGRATDNDMCIESKFISRHHCRIDTSERRCALEDVHSTNGLYVNDQRVRRHHLRDGDIVKIGQHRLHYIELRLDTDA
jgi:general secretion pathway protein A